MGNPAPIPQVALRNGHETFEDGGDVRRSPRRTGTLRRGDVRWRALRDAAARAAACSGRNRCSPSSSAARLTANGPGGWVILVEPELHFGNDVLVPDLAGWRRERVPDVARGCVHDARAGLDLRGAVALPLRRSIAARSCASTHAKVSSRLARRSAAANARSAGPRVGEPGIDRRARGQPEGPRAAVRRNRARARRALDLNPR